MACWISWYVRSPALVLAGSLLLLVGCTAGVTDPDGKPRTTPPPFIEPEIVPAPDGGTPAPKGLCERAPLERLDFALPVWDLYVSSERWDALHEDVYSDLQVEATICVDGQEYPIGLELQGASTRKAQKKSFDLKWNRGLLLPNPPFQDASARPAEPYARLIAKGMAGDHSLIREAVAFDLWRQMGHEAPRIGFKNLRINGDYWGLYVLVEPINKAYLRRHGYPEGGTLYKAVRKHGSRADFQPGRDLTLAFEKKTHESDPSCADLEALVHTLQHTPRTREAFERDIDPIFPLASYYERLIWVSFTQNGDATAQNFFLYNAPQAERDFWYQLPWDSNLCFSADWRSRDLVKPPSEGLDLDGRNYFGRRLVKVKELRDAYVLRFTQVLDEVLTPERVLEHIERYAAMVEHDLALDQKRWQRKHDPQTAFSVLRDFVAERPSVLREALTEFAATSLGGSHEEDDDHDDNHDDDHGQDAGERDLDVSMDEDLPDAGASAAG